MMIISIYVLHVQFEKEQSIECPYCDSLHAQCELEVQ